MRLSDRVVLVVGGGSHGPGVDGGLPMGNGRAMAVRFSSEGATVAVTDVRRELADETVSLLPHRGLALQADAADPEHCRGAVHDTLEAYGRLDALVCNVGVTGRQPARAQTVEDWERTLQINVRSHWLSAQAALEAMLSQGAGALLFVTSTSALYSSGTSLAYDASKAALLGVARHFAVRYGGRGIRANALALGVMATPMVQREWGTGEDLEAQRDGMCPMARKGRPEEAAAAAAFLVSDDASYVNGTCLVVDGGRLAGSMT